jgi:hydroxyacylglutathione hydrolase
MAVHIQTFEHESLGDRSYLIADRGSGLAAVVDPQREIEPYVRAAELLGCQIVLALETHLHNDFISGARRLHDEQRAEVVASRKAELAFPHRPVDGGDVVRLGDLEIEVLGTPGHTAEHVAYLARGDPATLFSGGALLPGGAARIDLFGAELAPSLAAAALDTIGRLLALDAATRVHATHGAGSFCSSGVQRRPETTVGDERSANRFAKVHDAATLLREATRDVPPVPRYYPRVRARNRVGAGAVPPLAPLAPQAFVELVRARRVTVLDTRSERDYCDAHLAGALAVPLGGAFGPWVAWIAPEEVPLALVLARDDLAGRVGSELGAVGRDDVAGYVTAVRDLGLPLAHVGRAQVELLQADYDATVVDVRWDAEWQEGHIPYALHIPLPDLAAHAGEVPRNGRVAVHCRSGYRSVIGVSLLERAGVANLAHLPGGIEAWGDAGGIVTS